MNTVSDYFKTALWCSLVMFIQLVMVSPAHIIIIIFDHGYKAYLLGTCRCTCLLKTWTVILLVFNVYQNMLVSVRKIKNKKKKKEEKQMNE